MPCEQEICSWNVIFPPCSKKETVMITAEGSLKSNIVIVTTYVKPIKRVAWGSFYGKFIATNGERPVLWLHMLKYMINVRASAKDTNGPWAQYLQTISY